MSKRRIREGGVSPLEGRDDRREGGREGGRVNGSQVSERCLIWGRVQGVKKARYKECE